MTPMKPEAFNGQMFQTVEYGYDPAEVDRHIRDILEHYSLLYRENASLLNRLRETEARLRTLEEEMPHTNQILRDAESQKNKIIEEAYLKADDILASAQMHCDSILRHLKDKTEAQEKTLSDMKKNILKFKNDLFERYRIHIELIENLFPSDEEEKNWTPDAYAQHIISELKRKVSDQYEIFPETQFALSFLTDPKQETDTEKNKKTPPTEQIIGNRPPTKKKFVKKAPSIMDLIDEYEDSAPKIDAKSPATQQFMLDFDHPSEEGVTIDTSSQRSLL